MTLGEYIKILKESKKCTHKKIIKELKITSQYWYDIEKDKRVPSDSLQKKIGNVLKLSDLEKINLYDLASKSHKKERVPVDISEYVLANEDIKKIIRSKIYEGGHDNGNN